MTAETVAQYLVSGESRLVLAAILIAACFLLRKYNKLGPDLDLISEGRTLALMIMPVAAVALSAGADWKETASTVITAILISIGWNSKKPLGTPAEPAEPPDPTTPPDLTVVE